MPQLFRQERQQVNNLHRGTLRQPGTAPSDGRLIPASPRASVASAAPLPADEKTGYGRRCLGVDLNTKEPNRSSLTKRSSSGRQPLQQQRQQRQKRQQLDSSERRTNGGSPSPPSVGERPVDPIVAAEDGNGGGINAVTDKDVRRAYAALNSRKQRNSNTHDDKVSSGNYVAAGIQREKPPPGLGLPLGDCDGFVKRVSGVQIFGSNHTGSVPLVPTGAPVSPARRGVVGRTGSLAQENSIAVAVEERNKLTVHTEMPRAQTPDGVSTKHFAPTEGTRDLEKGTRAPGISPLASTNGNLVALAREQADDIRAPPPQAPGFAMRPVEPAAAKLAAGLGTWADETAAVGRLVDQDSRRLADERAGEAREEEDIRRTLERDMGRAVKSLPLSFLKDFGYLAEAQKRGLEKTTRIMERMAAVALLRAWRK